jgi:hypothetical protein
MPLRQGGTTVRHDHAMTTTKRNRAKDVATGVGALLAVVAGIAAMFLAEQAFGHVTVGSLRALGMLGPDPYYTGTPLAAEPALWLVALIYVIPFALCAALVSRSRDFGAPGRRLRAGVDAALFAIAFICLMGLVWFAFDPSKSGDSTPLYRRWEELSYEASDLAQAATWTALIVAALLAMTWLMDSRRAIRVGLPVLAFVVVTPVLGSLFA